MSTFIGMPFEVVSVDERSLTIRYHPDALHRGPAGRVHGGVVLAACDHASAALGHRLGSAVLTGRIDVRLRAGVPLDEPFAVTATLLRRRPRALEVEVAVESGGTRRAGGTVLLVLPPPSKSE